jgi:hypothetical protein
MLFAGTMLVAGVGLLVQIAFDPHSPRWRGVGPAALGSVMLSPFCLALIYAECRVLAQRDAGAERFLGGAGMLLGGGLLFRLAPGTLGLLGMAPLDPNCATWAAAGWMGGVAAATVFLGGGHWTCGRYVDRGTAVVSDITAEP